MISLPKYVIREILSYGSIKDLISLKNTNKPLQEKIERIINENPKFKYFFDTMKDCESLSIKKLLQITQAIPIYQIISSCTLVKNQPELEEKISLFIGEKLNSLNCLIKFDIYSPYLQKDVSSSPFEAEICVGKKNESLFELLKNKFNAKTTFIFLNPLKDTKICEFDACMYGSSRSDHSYTAHYKIKNHFESHDTNLNPFSEKIGDLVDHKMRNSFKKTINSQLPKIKAKEALLHNKKTNPIQPTIDAWQKKYN